MLTRVTILHTSSLRDVQQNARRYLRGINYEFIDKYKIYQTFDLEKRVVCFFKMHKTVYRKKIVIRAKMQIHRFFFVFFLLLLLFFFAI